MKKPTIKAWALVCNNEVVYGTACDFRKPQHEDEYYLAVFETRNFAVQAKKNHPEFYKESKIVPVTISL